MIYTLTLNPALDLELTVDELAFDQVLRATASRADCGGKGFNVSRALAALGEPSVAIGFLGGKTGERLADALSQLDIPGDFVQVAGETRTNISIVTSPGSHYIKVNEPGAPIDEAAYARLLDKICKKAQAGDFWIFSGSLPPGLAATTYAEMIELVQAAGARAVLDTSGEALHYGCQARPFAVKPNAVEASQLTGIDIRSPEEAIRAAQQINADGITLALVSLGREGAILSQGKNLWRAWAPRVQESNPIGAGDATLAGFVYGLKNEFTYPEALRYGVACGAAAASLPGTTMGDSLLFEQFLREVSVGLLEN
jgi:1-phosphofructokinase family hexose kinase